MVFTNLVYKIFLNFPNSDHLHHLPHLNAYFHSAFSISLILIFRPLTKIMINFRVFIFIKTGLIIVFIKFSRVRQSLQQHLNRYVILVKIHEYDSFTQIRLKIDVRRRFNLSIIFLICSNLGV